MRVFILPICVSHGQAVKHLRTATRPAAQPPGGAQSGDIVTILLEMRDEMVEMRDEMVEMRDEVSAIAKSQEKLQESQEKLQDTVSSLEKKMHGVQLMNESLALQRLQEVKGKRYGKKKTFDSCVVIYRVYFEKDDTNPIAAADFFKILLDNIMGQLHNVAELVHLALCRIVEAGELKQIPDGANAACLGRWLDPLRAGGFGALHELVLRISKTVLQRDDSKFLLSCSSYAVGLLVFCSNISVYEEAIMQADTAGALASALPPYEFEVDGVGETFMMNGDLHIHIAEVKCSGDTKAWKQARVQLERALRAIGHVACCFSATFADEDPVLRYDNMVLVGYVGVPEAYATIEQLRTALLSYSNDEDEDEHLQIIFKPIILK